MWKRMAINKGGQIQFQRIHGNFSSAHWRFLRVLENPPKELIRIYFHNNKIRINKILYILYRFFVNNIILIIII